jgi:DNA-3-methyladenine glycosylase
LSGPGKLCAALGITRADSGLDLLSGPIAILRGRGRRPRLSVSPRIGVDYAGEAKDWPLRFFDADSPAVTGRRASVGK